MARYCWGLSRIWNCQGRPIIIYPTLMEYSCHSRCFGGWRFLGLSACEPCSVRLLLLLKMLVERLGVGILPFDLFSYRPHLLYDRVLAHIKPLFLPAPAATQKAQTAAEPVATTLPSIAGARQRTDHLQPRLPHPRRSKHHIRQAPYHVGHQARRLNRVSGTALAAGR